jgi:3-isopropylmalate/(R)-2-methylmalate dehydratase small subunit
MRVWKFGNDIDTDAIIPGRFLTIYDELELATHAFEGTRDEFSKTVAEGDIIVAGTNFGCGSSREHAPLAIRGAGVLVIIAESFARIFYRNAINTGLLPITCADAGKIPDGAGITVNAEEGYVEFNGARYPVDPVPAFMLEIIRAGGLVEYARAHPEVKRCTE